VIDVRPATADDVPAMVDLHARVAAEGVWIGTEPPVDTDRFTRLFTQSIQSDDRLRLVAVDSGRVVGNLSLDPTSPGILYLGMTVDADYRGQGTGTAMVVVALEWARAQPGVHKVELEVWPHNAAGLALYRKVGFDVEGRRWRHYRRRNGELWDAILMALVLDDTSPGSSHSDQAGLAPGTLG
jgi:RimJ/RimL family protein N-acetyltransferase